MGPRASLANWERAIFLPLPVKNQDSSVVQPLAYSFSDTTGLADNFVERKVFVYLRGSALFSTVFVRLADKLLNVWPTVVKNIVREMTVDNVIWNVRLS